MSVDACPNCQKPVLPGDTMCWHCGFELPRKPAARQAAKGNGRPTVAAAGATADETAVAEADYDLRALAIYGLLTVAIILGLWLVLRALSGYPVLVRSAAPSLGGDWVSVTDTELRYTVSIPSDWLWIDATFRDDDELLAELMRRQPYIASALRPSGGRPEVLGVAVVTSALEEETDPATFAVIATSERLAGLSLREAVDLLAEEPVAVAERSVDTRLAGQPQARFKTQDTAEAYRCSHLFLAIPDHPAYLVAVCEPNASFGGDIREPDDILDSFQLLEY